MSKFYAIANGHKIGIFNSWEIAKPLVSGYSGAKYKSFKTFQEAQAYLQSNEAIQIPNPLYSPNIPKAFISERIVGYTDGSCVKQTGGYGFIAIVNQTEIPLSGKVPAYPTTNQVAELYAIYSLIQYLLQNYKNHLLQNGLMIYTDSKYSIGCLTEWHYNWSRNNWVNSKGEKVSNKELIQSILNLSTGLDIKYEHVKAHNGDKYNEWADRLANAGRQ